MERVSLVVVSTPAFRAVEGSTGLGLSQASPGSRSEVCYLCPAEAKHRWQVKQRQRSFLGRFFSGVELGRSRSETFGWFCLTESDQALVVDLSWEGASNSFFVRLRHRCPGIAYCWVEHRQGQPSVVTGLQRRNVHVFWRWSGVVPPLFVAETWERLYLSSVRRIQVLPDLRLQKAGRYLAFDAAGTRNGQEKFIKARFSHNWLFDGSVGHYWSYRKSTGRKPDVGYMVSLANLPDLERDRELSQDGRGFKRVDLRLQNDADRVLRGTFAGPYVDPAWLRENWGRV